MSPVEPVEYDVVCVGSGAAALTAAITAHEHGRSVLLVEKSAKIGGVAAISGGQCWVPANHLAEQAGIADSVEAGLAYLMFAGGAHGDEARARHYCTYARQAVKFLADHAGVAWQIVPVPDPFHGFAESTYSLPVGRLLEVGVFPGSSLGAVREITRSATDRITDTEAYGGPPDAAEVAARQERDDRARGGSLVGSLVKSVLDRGIEFWTQAGATSLVVTEGRVSGVRVQRGDQTVEVSARRGVLVATGGYDSSLRERLSFDAGHEVSTVSLPSVTGDHLRLAGRLGARVAAPFRPPHTFLEPDVPEIVDADGVIQRDRSVVRPTLPHAIIVNRQGRRFHDETMASGRDAALLALDVHEPWKYTNFPCWAVWDAHHAARYLPPPAARTPGVLSAPTLRELATAAGIDPDGLAEDVARFNANVAAGHDSDFGRGAFRAGQLHGDLSGGGDPTLGPIEQAPFYAVRLVQRTMGIPQAGLVTDEHARVLDWDDRPIEGLYAAGGAVAMLEIGLNYTGGNANARGILQGFCAGNHLGSDAPAARPGFDPSRTALRA